MLQYHHEHTAYLLHRRYTSCVRTFTLHKTRSLVLVLLLFFSKQIKHTSEGELSRMLHKHLEHTAYMLHKRYTIHVRKFTLRYKHRPVLVLLSFSRNKSSTLPKESYREFYTNSLSTQHTCYAKHIPSMFEIPHSGQRRCRGFQNRTGQ